MTPRVKRPTFWKHGAQWNEYAASSSSLDVDTHLAGPACSGHFIRDVLLLKSVLPFRFGIMTLYPPFEIILYVLLSRPSSFLFFIEATLPLLSKRFPLTSLFRLWVEVSLTGVLAIVFFRLLPGAPFPPLPMELLSFCRCSSSVLLRFAARRFNAASDLVMPRRQHAGIW